MKRFSVIVLTATLGHVTAVPVTTVDDLNPLTFGVGLSQLALAPGETVQVLNYTLSPSGSSGVVTHWWMTGIPLSNGPDPSSSLADYTVWAFYVDGEASPSVEVQMSQACFVGQGSVQAPWGNDYAGKNSKFGGWHSNVYVPFSSSIRVTITLQPWVTSKVNTTFVMVRGVENIPVTVGAYTLPPTARLTAFVRNASLAVLDLHELASFPPGTRGLMLAASIDMTLYGPNAANTNSLEGCWHFYRSYNDTWPGQLLGTGGEDYPESAYYFNAGPYRGPTSGLTVWNIASPTLAHVSFYKLHHRDPIFFRDGMRFVWRNGDVADENGFKCLAATGGTTIGSPTPANVSTLVYAYTW